MSVSLLLEMAASDDPDRTAVISNGVRLTTQQLSDLADGGAAVIAASGAGHVAYVGTGGAALPVLLFASARAGVAFTPVNYRLAGEGIRALIERLPEPLVIIDEEYRDTLADVAPRLTTTDEFLTAARGAEPAVAEFPDPESVAVVLFTSGTTSQPKAVELSHNNLSSYVMGTVEFASAEPDDAALICVPPYHIAGVGAALSNLYAGRKMVYLPTFDAAEWVRLVNDEGSPPRRWCPPCSTASSTCWRQAAMSCRRCAPWPTAAPKWACRWCAGRCNSCRRWASSTPTA